MSKPSEQELQQKLNFIKETKDKRKTHTQVHREHKKDNLFPPFDVSWYIPTPETTSSLPFSITIDYEPTM